MAIWVDGVETTQVSALDRGLAYGDGVFETIAVQAGKCLFWQAHCQRLLRGLRHLGIDTIDIAALSAKVETVIQDCEKAVLKIIVTRGEGGRGYASNDVGPPRCIISTHAWPEYAGNPWCNGARVRLCDCRLSSQPKLAGLKHLNRLEQVLARQEWQEAAIHEGLMLGQQERVIEGTMSNCFFYLDGQWHTPRLDQCGVAGIVRDWVINTAQSLGQPVQLGNISLEMLKDAEAIFFTNSIIGIWPVREIDGIFQQQHWPQTLKWQERYERATR